MSVARDASPQESRVLGLEVERAPDSVSGAAVVTWGLVALVLVLSLAGVLRPYLGLLWMAPLVPLVIFGRRYPWRQVTLLALSIMTAEIAAQLLTAAGWVAVPWWVFGLATTAGASACLGAAAAARRLKDEHRRAVHDAMQAAYWDPATGLPSRRVAGIFLDREFGMARRGEALAAVLFHLEGLDEIGRKYSQQFVEQVLTKFGQLLAETTRQMDFVGRYGDDTVLALLSGEDPIGAATFAERIRKKAADFQFELQDGSMVRSGVVVSAGVSAYEDSMEESSDLTEAARSAVHRARELGGGRVVVSGREGAFSGSAGGSERGEG